MLLTAPIVKAPEPVEPEHLVGDKIQPGHPLFGLIWVNPDRVSGAPCFYATRLPIATLFGYLAAGHTADEFVEDFEGVTKEHVLLVIDLAGQGLLADLEAL